jgi:alkylation response protein AidB-like acyl-CoA dehydrogenase
VALRAADGFIDTETLRLQVWQLAWQLDAGLPARGAAATAKWWACEAGHRVSHTAQHLHGGMGADISYPRHRYFLWSRALEITLGGASSQLARLGDWLAEEPAAGVLL